MVSFGKVELFEVFGENDNGVADEKVGEMSSKKGVHAAVHELLLDIRIEDKVRIKILLPKSRVFGNVRGIRCIT